MLFLPYSGNWLPSGKSTQLCSRAAQTTVQKRKKQKTKKNVTLLPPLISLLLKNLTKGRLVKL